MNREDEGWLLDQSEALREALTKVPGAGFNVYRTGYEPRMYPTRAIGPDYAWAPGDPTAILTAACQLAAPTSSHVWWSLFFTDDRVIIQIQGLAPDRYPVTGIGIFRTAVTLLAQVIGVEIVN